MDLFTKRLILRPWVEEDARLLYEYAKDPKVGPAAGWPIHTSEENSREIIKEILAVPESYAVCLKDDNSKAIGSVGISIGEKSKNMDIPKTEGEIGYWIGVPFWGKGFIPEAVEELLRHGFLDLNLDKIWSAYYEGNIKSKRVQEKCGFKFNHTKENKYIILLDDYADMHCTCITKDQWKEKN